MAISQYYAYHLWATRKLSKLLLQFDEKFLTKESPSSFPNIKRTLAHMAWAEEIWLNRMKGTDSRAWEDWTSSPSSQIIDEYVRINRSMVDFLTSSRPENKVTYSNTAGNEFTQTIGEIGIHVVNHASYHRGQIVTLLRANNFEQIPSFDFINYLRT